MDPFAGVGAFLAVAEAKSFTAGAQRLGISKAAASDQVARLERRLGVRLLRRNTRNVSLTEAGAAYYDRLSGLLRDHAEAERAAVSLHAQPRGVVSVSAPEPLAITHIVPLLPEFSAAHPKVQIDLRVTNTFVDLVAGNVDLALRISPQLEPHTVVRPMAEYATVLCASPDYLARAGTPRTPDDLQTHSCIVYSLYRHGHHWPIEFNGVLRRVPVDGPLITDNSQALIAAAVSGLGIIFVPDYMVSEFTTDGRLTAVLPKAKLPRVSLGAVYPDNRHIALKVRAFVNFLARRLREHHRR